MNIPVLSLLLFVPLLGSLLCAVSSSKFKNNVTVLAIFIGSITLILNIFIVYQFDNYNPHFQFIENYTWIPAFNIAFELGLDNLSLLMVSLTNILFFFVIYSASRAIENGKKNFLSLLFLLQTFINGSFLANDLFVFYLFFEGVLIPMYFIIGIWGGPNRNYAAMKFFLFTFAGSVLMLVGIIKLYTLMQGSSFFDLKDLVLNTENQKFLFWCFFASFAVKVPLFPFHTWLPDAHVEAPTSGSMILAGVLLKLGLYGFIRINIPIFPQATIEYIPILLTLGVVGTLWASFIALGQNDIKKIIAYSSIAHMGTAIIGIFAVNHDSLNGAIVIMLSHGVVSAGLFFSIGIIYQRFKTRDLQKLSGIASIMPEFTILFGALVFASIALPFSASFIGEILVFLGAFQNYPIAVCFAVLGVILSAGYMLRFVKKAFFGSVSHAISNTINSHEQKISLALTLPERICLYFFVLLSFGIGIYPNFILSPIRRHSRAVLSEYNHTIKPFNTVTYNAS